MSIHPPRELDPEILGVGVGRGLDLLLLLDRVPAAELGALDLEIVNTLLQLGELMRQIAMLFEDHWVVPFYILKDFGSG